MRVRRFLSCGMINGFIRCIVPMGIADEAPALPDERRRSAPPGKMWRLFWSDEFNGQDIGAAKWNIEGDHVRKGGGSLKKGKGPQGPGPRGAQARVPRGVPCFRSALASRGILLLLRRAGDGADQAGGVPQVERIVILSTEVNDRASDIRQAKPPDKALADQVRVYDWSP